MTVCVTGNEILSHSQVNLQMQGLTHAPIYNSLPLSLCGLSLLSPIVPQLDCFLVRLACGSESSPQADMIPNPIQLQTEKTIWSDSMLEPPDGALGSDVLFLEKQKKGGKM